MKPSLRLSTVAVGVGIAVASGCGVASADPGSSGVSAISPADVASSVQHEAPSAGAAQGRTQSGQTGSPRPAAATDNQQPAAVVGDKPSATARPVRDAIAKLQKQAQVLSQVTTALAKLFGR